MTANDRRVALVSIADNDRIALTNYLRSAGFDVHACNELVVPSSFDSLLWLAGDTPSADVVSRVRSWMRLTKHQRVVVVTSKPAVLRDIVIAHADRLSVLAAPAFGWDLVDALRARETPRPRGA